jgi:glutaredoxin
MATLLNIATSTLASTVRRWRGTTASKVAIQPDEHLILFDREGCPECRFAREALTELNLNAVIAPCPIGGRNIANLAKESGSDTLPRVFDPNTDLNIVGRDEVVKYLFKEYRGVEVPKQLKRNIINNSTSMIATILRNNAGIDARHAKEVKTPLTLYSFESSPFSRIVREKLCELEIPYLLINLGKQQLADMGTPQLRFNIGPYRPLENTKRDSFFKKYGNVQVPYLLDPNTQVEMFESQQIVDYLESTYAL